MTYAESSFPDIGFAALADPTRRTLFEAVVRDPRPVGVLAADLPVSRPAVSQHLKILGDAGLVEAVPMGNKRIYRANRAGIAQMRRYLDGLWDDVLDAFADSFETEGPIK